MNPFAVTEDHQLLAENFRRLLQDTNEFSARRERLARVPVDRLALWAAFADQGVIAAAFDEARGGFAGDARTIAVIMAEIGRSLAVEPYLATAVVAGRVLMRWTDERARQATIESIIAGRHVSVLAHNAFGDPFVGPGLRATAAGHSTILSGVVPAVRHAELADEFLIPARCADQSIEIYRIDRDHPGLTTKAYRLIDASAAADVCLHDVQLPAAAQLTFDAPTRDVFDAALEWGILGLAAESAGIVSALNEATFAYLMERKQFGVAIGSFQALQHRAADMWIAAEEILAMVDLVVDSLSCARPPIREPIISAAKVVADTAGHRVAAEAVQLHGGMGVSDELIISHYFRRLTTIRGELGSADAHRLRFRSMQ